MPVWGGACATIGVPKDGCAEGFVHDGTGGCTPVLPAMSCPPGKTAIPGDTTCRDVAPCGEGTFGSIVAEPNTLFVDGSVASSGDGTRASPFKTVDEALAKVRRGTRPIIALAAGVYPDIILEVDARVIGRCPAMVEVRGTDATYAAVEVFSDAEVRGIAVTGPGPGILAASGSKLAIADVWVHATTRFGIGVQGLGASDEHPATIDNALVEDVKEFGIWIFGGEATVSRSVVRDIREGMGVRAEIYAKTSTPAHLTLKRSLVERAHEVGVSSLASKVDVFGTAVLDTLPRVSDKRLGAGFSAVEYPKTKARGELNVTQSFVSGSRRAGLYFDNSSGKIDRTVVRDGHGVDDGRYGDGAQFLYGSTVEVVDSLFVGNRNTGIAFAGSTGTIERTLVRDTQPSQSDKLGFGIAAWNLEAEGSDVRIRSCRVSKAHDSAISIGASHVVIEDSALLDTLPRSDGLFGDGLTVTSVFGRTLTKSVFPASVTLARSLIARSRRAGVLLDGATLELRDSALECNALDLQVTDDLGTRDTGEKVTSPWTLGSSGLVSCGCGTTLTTCTAQQSSIAPAAAPTYD